MLVPLWGHAIAATATMIVLFGLFWLVYRQGSHYRLDRGSADVIVEMDRRVGELEADLRHLRGRVGENAQAIDAAAEAGILAPTPETDDEP